MYLESWIRRRCQPGPTFAFLSTKLASLVRTLIHNILEEEISRLKPINVLLRLQAESSNCCLRSILWKTMAENPRVHCVRFTNETPETVTFVVETRRGPQSAFTLKPQKFRNEEVHPQTYQTLRLVVGEYSKGHYTNISISSDELDHLDEVVVTSLKTNPGNSSVSNSVDNFVLKTTPRKTKERPSVTRPRWPWSRSRINETAPSGRLDV